MILATLLVAGAFGVYAYREHARSVAREDAELERQSHALDRMNNVVNGLKQDRGR
jgi:hypothetical protein